MTKDEQDALETVTKATVDAALEPVKTALTNVASPFTAEIGKLIALPFKWWNFRASFAIMEKAKKFLDEKGIKPQQVPMKLLAPILEYGSLEDDESMQDRWAKLLASAADQNFNNRILPSFSSILKELSPVDAMILDRIYGTVIQYGDKSVTNLAWIKSIISVEESFADLSIPSQQKAAVFENLGRMALIQDVARLNARPITAEFHPTHLGFSFVEACFVPRENLGRIVFYNGGIGYSFGNPPCVPSTKP